MCAKKQSLCREQLWHGARVMAFGMWGFSLLSYVCCFMLYPEAFSFSAQALVVIAPIFAGVPAIGSLILALCAGDAVFFAINAEEN